MGKPVFSYDTRCWDLAMYFLGDRMEPETIRLSENLAQDIQDAVEAWFAGRQPITAASAYDTLPCDSEPVVDTPISGEPK